MGGIVRRGLFVLTLGAVSVLGAVASTAPEVSGAILARFEKDVNELALELDRNARERVALTREGERLRDEVERLRRETQGRPHMLKEARLKSLLGDLKVNLERQAEGGRRAEEQHRIFEEQVLSLAVLYNDRLENLLGAYRRRGEGARGTAEREELLGLIGRRASLQHKAEALRGAVLTRDLGRFPDLTGLQRMDRIDLLLVKGLLKDREARLVEQTERSELEELELNRQLRLEAEARALLGTSSRPTAREPGVLEGLRALSLQATTGQRRLLALRGEKRIAKRWLSQTRGYLRAVEKRLAVSAEKDMAPEP